MSYHHPWVGWRGCAWFIAFALCASHASAAIISTGNADLSGWVYIDRNNDGVLAYADEENPELVLVGAAVELYQITNAGESLVATALTDGNGYYSFENIAAGSYSLRQVQPEGYVDGIDTLGEILTTSGQLTTQAVEIGQLALDAFEDITLASATMGISYNFGERGLMPGYVSKRYLLATATPMGFAERQVPEPSTLLMASLAVAGAWMVRRRCA